MVTWSLYCTYRARARAQAQAQDNTSNGTAQEKISVKLVFVHSRCKLDKTSEGKYGLQ